MTRQLPPLNPLRVFEAAARHLSFTHAAEELHITQSAVSQQVRVLEDYLGVQLFRRLTRKLLLTENGQVLLPVVRDAFDRIDNIAKRFRNDVGRRTLTVTVSPYLSAKWLTPRIGQFLQQHSGLDLRLHHSVHLVDFSRDEVEMAVQWGDGNWPGVTAEPLFSVDFTPVYSPVLHEGRHPLRTAADLKYHTLLHQVDYSGWIQWLTMAGTHGIDPRRGAIIDDGNVLIQAAIDGQGIALRPLSFITDHVAAGRLVRPFELTVTTDYAYYLAYPPDILRSASIKAFRDWLLAEAAADREGVVT